ncbi:unnamed protein product [Moneuplotes crassus]|uniref:Uncharacterized protein n=1 Tax=Euplotes crassus TaxID=5936 RepID=A0AAD1XDD2_EUPCR|nr:unnamed protein product [Moneuplotes crassus]
MPNKIKEHRRAEFQRILINIYKKFGVKYMIKETINSLVSQDDAKSDLSQDQELKIIPEYEEDLDNNMNEDSGFIDTYILKTDPDEDYHFGFKIKLKNSESLSQIYSEINETGDTMSKGLTPEQKAKILHLISENYLAEDQDDSSNQDMEEEEEEGGHRGRINIEMLNLT